MTAYTGTPALPTAADGQRIFGADIAALIAAMHGLCDSWIDVSAALASGWTAPTSPAIGNGVAEARYMQVGKLVIYTGRIFMGSSTTFGAGTWSIPAPVAAQSATGLNAGGASFFDNSTATNRQGGSIVSNGATGFIFYGGAGTTGGPVGGSAPFAWAVSDRLTWTIVYEAA